MRLQTLRTGGEKPVLISLNTVETDKNKYRINCTKRKKHYSRAEGGGKAKKKVYQNDLLIKTIHLTVTIFGWDPVYSTFYSHSASQLNLKRTSGFQVRRIPPQKVKNQMIAPFPQLGIPLNSAIFDLLLGPIYNTNE